MSDSISEYLYAMVAGPTSMLGMVDCVFKKSKACVETYPLARFTASRFIVNAARESMCNCDRDDFKDCKADDGNVRSFSSFWEKEWQHGNAKCFKDAINMTAKTKCYKASMAKYGNSNVCGANDGSVLDDKYNIERLRNGQRALHFPDLKFLDFVAGYKVDAACRTAVAQRYLSKSSFAKATRTLSPEAVWAYKCLSISPNATCQQHMIKCGEELGPEICRNATRGKTVPHVQKGWGGQCQTDMQELPHDIVF